MDGIVLVSHGYAKIVMVGEPEARGTGKEPGILLKIEVAATVGARIMVVPVSMAA